MSNEEIDVFRFVSLRDSEKIASQETRKKYIRDDAYFYRDGPLVVGYFASSNTNSTPTGIHDVDLFSKQSLSIIGKAVVHSLDRGLPKNQIIKKVEDILIAGFKIPEGDQLTQLPPVIKQIRITNNISARNAMLAGLLNQKPYYSSGNTVRILPDQIADIQSPLSWQLNTIQNLYQNVRKLFIVKPEKKFDVVDFIDSLSENLQLTKTQDRTEVTDLVFNINSGTYTLDFLLTKRIFFDALYGLYILRKRERVSLEPVIQGLQALQFLEWMAIAQYFVSINSSSTSATSSHLKEVLETIYPGLAMWKSGASNSLEPLSEIGLPFSSDWAEVETLMQAVPVISPIIARISNDMQPFSSITPVGIGDLKVVRQKFLGYRKGELAHVETVLAGETKVRFHKSSEKTQDTFSFTSSSESENTKDSQSTSRFELKNEAENVIKENLSVNANLSAGYNYNNGMVVVNASAGLSYTNSKDVSLKSSRNFVNEIISKATSRIVNKSSNERSRTIQMEIEESNTHTFANDAHDADHISGMYRWLDKMYEGQVYNYGQRVMLEVVLPEPAAFYVQSRLMAYAASLDLPIYPGDGGSTTGSGVFVKPVLNAAEINEEVFNTLKTKFKIGHLPPPAREIYDIPVFYGSGANNQYVKQHNDQNDLIWDTYADASIRAGIVDQYDLMSCRVTGSLDFYDKDPNGGAPENRKNKVEVQIDQNPIFFWMNDRIMGFHEYDERYDLIQPRSTPEVFQIDIGTQTNKTYALKIYLNFVLKPAKFAEWQTSIFNLLTEANLIAVPADDNKGLPDAKLQAYEDILSKVSPAELNETITGKSPAENELIIQREIKRGCISMIAREFDSINSDDLVSGKNAIGKLNVQGSIFFPSFTIHKGDDIDTNTTTYAKFEDKNEGSQSFDVPNVSIAVEKGRFIQFIEQAFEWEHISQIFYPYFWADIPKWVELMHRQDPGDPIFTNFLQSGSARVLLAIRPGYEGAVAHFLATGEPWAGGPSPVIGDTLYLPLYDEIRSNQDSLSGAKPDGTPWTFALPTSLIYLESKKYPLVDEYK